MLSRCFNEGGLPAEESKLLRLFRCDENDLKECVKMFYKKDEKLFNKKLDAIQKDQKKVSSGRSKAGKASAEARRNKRLTEGANVEQMLNKTSTKDQQNLTNTTQQNRTDNRVINNSLSEQSSDGDSWLEKADDFYLNLCEWFYGNLIKLDLVKKNTNWKTKSWYNGFRLLLTNDGVDYETEFRPIMNFYLQNYGKQFCPIAESPASVRTKWKKIEMYYKNGNRKPLGSARP